jgi:hypothetical protein
MEKYAVGGWCLIRIPFSKPKLSFLGTDTAPSSGVSSPTNIRNSVVLPPIGTDPSDFFAGIQLKRSIYEEQLLAILLIDV